jgi:Mg-chelatase subunit ChlD
VLVTLALSDPRWRGNRDDAHVVWLVDVSRSVGKEAIKLAEDFIAKARQKNKISSDSIIVFGGRSSVVKDLPFLTEFTSSFVEDEATDFGQALNFADASTPAGYVKTVVLFSDGVETRGDALRVAEELKKRGLRVHTRMVEPPDSPEVLVRSVGAPAHVAEGKPFRLTAEVVANREQEALLTVFRNGVKTGAQTIQLKNGNNRFEISQTAGSEKLAEFSAVIEAKQDSIADNNQASCVVQTGGKARALLISDKPQQARYLAAALKQEDAELDVRPSNGVPTDLADLQNYDVVFFDNVSATDLTARQMTLMASYVRDFGGGFVMLGGDQSFGLGGYFRTPIEDMLPVRCDFEKEKENPSLALVIVVDRSGSMGGEKIEMVKEASKAAVQLLSSKDYAGVIVFDSQATSIVDLQPATDIGGIQQRIASIGAGGGTNISPGLEMAYSQLSRCPAKLKHVILLTDGQSEQGPYQEILSRMSAGTSRSAAWRWGMTRTRDCCSKLPNGAVAVSISPTARTIFHRSLPRRRWRRQNRRCRNCRLP